MSRNDNRTIMRVSYKRKANIANKYHRNLLRHTNLFKRQYATEFYSNISSGKLPNIRQMLEGFFLAITIMLVKVVTKIAKIRDKK